MNNAVDAPNDEIDAGADAEIAACLDPDALTSFFLFAGAGSGKTRSLVAALTHVQAAWGAQLRQRGQSIAVITFTNAACDEIKRRVQFDPLFDVRTIHSFAWSLIEGLNTDIRAWLADYLRAEIADLHEKEAKGRAGKARDERIAKIAAYEARLAALHGIRKFIYSPTGANRTRDALSHAEVIKITAHFLSEKPRMRSIFVGRYPILLVDESQDTNAALVDAFFRVDSEHSGAFAMGLIGDMMQRIYADGKEDLGVDLPPTWRTPKKVMNHRCPSRIIELLNAVRSPTDQQTQRPRSDAIMGSVRLFILSAEHPDVGGVEAGIAQKMAQITGDNAWAVPMKVKTLTLEHKMAARRLGCFEVFSALYALDSQSLLQRTQSVALFFTDQVLPVLEAHQAEDRFGLMRLLKVHSPLMAPAALAANPGRGHLAQVKGAVDSLAGLLTDGQDLPLLVVLREVARSNLFEIPERLAAWATESDAEANVEEGQPERDAKTLARIEAIDELLAAPFSQITPLREYLEGRARFDTHQGVKGLEFERVMVVMDDFEAKGFSFKYGDLFGGKDEGKIVESTRRLFYVVASRAEKSLALVAYTKEPRRVRDFALRSGWLEDDEILVI
ncbi:UvrD-helicase domain-containing protein [Luteimonas sp. WGS1318]|uniref:UvrD-helicase domain-containing protein n=1 Tax=Luteimonas sp. WGS1318 TaxID=3366815 RepID=UPI00372D4877